MAYTLPNFNLLCDMWDPGHAPGLGDPPDHVAVPCQLYVLSRGSGAPQLQLRVPSTIIGLNIFVGTTPPVGSATGVEIDLFPGYYFAVTGNAVVMHAGFPNEYWACQLIHTDNTISGALPAWLPYA